MYTTWCHPTLESVLLPLCQAKALEENVGHPSPLPHVTCTSPYVTICAADSTQGVTAGSGAGLQSLNVSDNEIDAMAAKVLRRALWTNVGVKNLE